MEQRDIKTLKRLVSNGVGLQRLGRLTPAGAQNQFEGWENEVTKWLLDTGQHISTLASWGSQQRPIDQRLLPCSDAEYWQTYVSTLRSRSEWLSKLAVSLEMESDSAPRDRSKGPPSTRIFIVHGRSEGPRESVARFTEKLGLTPVILHEQPNKGRTIIEKFVDYADVSFAVILLTGDDRGGLADELPESYQPRARQNVILELGFFLGRLRRDRVCALYEEGVQVPSDYQGVLFVPLDDAGAWRLALAKEMKEAGLPVDMNKAV